VKVVALVAALTLLAGCGPKTVKLTGPELEQLFQCVTEQDDQVERGNCVERVQQRLAP
jgi:phosphotransferase system IIA component